MGAASSIVWNDYNDFLSQDEVKEMLGDKFDEEKFNSMMNKETKLMERTVLMEIVNSHCDSSPEKIGIQLPESAKKSARARVRSMENSRSTPSLGSDRLPRKMSMEDNDSDGPKANADSWESVQAQPSCAICGMVFTSSGKLETHIKYSSVHVSNLKKLDTMERANSPHMKEVPKGILDQEGGISKYQLYYSGTKSYWRTQDNLDIAIYSHVGVRTLEVIAHDAKANYEYPRIYLDEAKITTMVTEKTIWDKVDAYIEAEKNKKFKNSDLAPREVLYNEQKRLLISSFVLQRLKLSVDGKSPAQNQAIDANNLVKATHELLIKQDAHFKKLGVHSPRISMQKQVYYVPETKDNVQDVVYDLAPDNIEPVVLQRRRHSTDKEIRDTLEAVEKMQNDIRGMTAKAEKIANKVHQGIEVFKSAVKSRSQKIATYSKPRQRWIFAINRVLLQGKVRRVTELLLSYGDKYYTEPK